MVEWMQSNWLPLLVFIIAIGLLIFFIIKKRGLKQAAIDAIVYAQKYFYGEEGAKRMDEAISYIKDLVPVLKFIPNAIIRDFIQSVFDQIEDALKLEVSNISVESNPEQITEEISTEVIEDNDIIE